MKVFVTSTVAARMRGSGSRLRDGKASQKHTIKLAASSGNRVLVIEHGSHDFVHMCAAGPVST